MPQYPTPQFIEEEGRIVFFLTFRQFFLLVGGGFLCAFLYYVTPFWVFAVLAVPIMFLSVAVAFVKIQNEGIISIFMHMLGFSFGKKNYIWQKKEMPISNGQNPTMSKLEETKKIIETKK